MAHDRGQHHRGAGRLQQAKALTRQDDGRGSGTV
jgi:hypothetical protein